MILFKRQGGVAIDLVYILNEMVIVGANRKKPIKSFAPHPHHNDKTKNTNLKRTLLVTQRKPPCERKWLEIAHFQRWPRGSIFQFYSYIGKLLHEILKDFWKILFSTKLKYQLWIDNVAFCRVGRIFENVPTCCLPWTTFANIHSLFVVPTPQFCPL